MIHGIDVKARPFCLTDSEEAWVRETLNGMTRKEKAGQLFCLMAQPGKENELKEIIREYALGGVLYRPVLTKTELKETLDELEAASKYPLLKAANLEEGGNGAAKDGFRFASQMGTAASKDFEDVRRLAIVCAAEALETGLNWSFSPVADLDLNFRNPIANVRTYGSDAGKAGAAASAYVEILQEAGVAACGKHFPGDGVDFRDQHLHPTINALSKEQWHETFGAVYGSMIEAGVLSIMAGHILEPALERGENPALTDEELLPASLSPLLLKNILRKKLGFNGLIITDATIMNGYCMSMERKKAIPQSIMAGCDMICFSLDFYEDVEYLLKGIENGLLTEERLDEAVVRCLALKAWAKRSRGPAPKLPKEQWAAECADRAVTLVKDRKKNLPFKKENYDRVRLVFFGEDETPDGNLKELVKKALQKEGLETEEYAPNGAGLTGPAKLDKRLLTLYISNFEAKANRTAVRLDWGMNYTPVTPRHPKEADYAFLSFANPYHLADVPRMPVYVNAYTASRFTVEAAIGKLFGRSEFQGVNPVDPFCGLMDTKL